MLFIIPCITRNFSDFTFVKFMKAFTKCNKIVRQDNELFTNYRRENYFLEFISYFHFSELWINIGVKVAISGVFIYHWEN